MKLNLFVTIHTGDDAFADHPDAQLTRIADAVKHTLYDVLRNGYQEQPFFVRDSNGNKFARGVVTTSGRESEVD